MKHVLVYGPQGCGKTLNKDFLAAQFGCESIDDGVSLYEFKDKAVRAFGKTLYITSQIPEVEPSMDRRAEVLSFGEAMNRAGLPTYGQWASGETKPAIGGGTAMAVRMRGKIDLEDKFVEVNGFYLNEYGLFFEDGCECFEEGENPVERERHDNHGCPHSGFYYVDPDGGEDAWYQPFTCAHWCSR